MKKIAVLIGFFVLFVLSAAVYAHPPSDIKITFNPETKILNAVIFHNVSNPSKHYIKEVDVFLNGKKIIQQSISAQDNFDSQTVSYLIPDAKIGDLFAVEGDCSISGKLEKQLKI